jgi:hypothetical protein
LVLGAGSGAWDLIATRAGPLAEDTPAALLSFYGPMFAAWGLAGLTAARQTGRLRDAMTVGAVVAFVTFVVFDLAVILRVNLFLDSLRQRADWQNLVRRYPESGFRSFRAYANFTYAVGAPFKILVASVIGAGIALLGGVLGRLRRARTRG